MAALRTRVSPIGSGKVEYLPSGNDGGAHVKSKSGNVAKKSREHSACDNTCIITCGLSKERARSHVIDLVLLITWRPVKTALRLVVKERGKEL
ncbi:hypothetical protein VNO78_00892 [Psophocarpus tetragonolobus]|uniref:Uncharacterized protein n=1 Tax=Psophocarpus tetragonolobus TaxID=3891 RepID=A0AAN9T111_PSOTE